MFELIALLVLAVVAGGAVLFVGLLLKLAFKLLLLPFTLAIGLVKLVAGIVVGVVVAVLAVALAPVALVLLVFVALPLLALFALFGLGWAAAAA